MKTTSNPRAAPKNNPVAASHRQIPRVPASSGTSRPATENVEDAGEEYREGVGEGNETGEVAVGLARRIGTTNSGG